MKTNNTRSQDDNPSSWNDAYLAVGFVVIMAVAVAGAVVCTKAE